MDMTVHHAEGRIHSPGVKQSSAAPITQQQPLSAKKSPLSGNVPNASTVKASTTTAIRTKPINLVAKSIPLQKILESRRNDISSLLLNGIINYYDMKLPSGYFDFISARSRNITAFFRMANHFKFDCSNVEQSIEQFIITEFKSLISQSNELAQVRNVALHIMSIYLNDIGCPPNFTELF